MHSKHNLGFVNKLKSDEKHLRSTKMLGCSARRLSNNENTFLCLERHLNTSAVRLFSLIFTESLDEKACPRFHCTATSHGKILREVGWFFSFYWHNRNSILAWVFLSTHNQALPPPPPPTSSPNFFLLLLMQNI